MNSQAIIFKDVPSYREFETAVTNLLEVKRRQERDGDSSAYENRLRVCFNRPVEIATARRRKVRGEVLDVEFWVSSQGRLCYSRRRNRRTGYAVSDYFPFNEAYQISLIPKGNEDALKLRQVQNLAGLIYPGTWPGLAQDLQQTPEKYTHHHPLRVNITRKFPPHVIENLRQAFAERREYRYSLSGRKRDLTVSVQINDRGEVRGYFSSEFAGTGNGQYWLLVNPETAILQEED